MSDIGCECLLDKIGRAKLTAVACACSLPQAEGCIQSLQFSVRVGFCCTSSLSYLSLQSKVDVEHLLEGVLLGLVPISLDIPWDMNAPPLHIVWMPASRWLSAYHLRPMDGAVNSYLIAYRSETGDCLWTADPRLCVWRADMLLMGPSPCMPCKVSCCLQQLINDLLAHPLLHSRTSQMLGISH